MSRNAPNTGSSALASPSEKPTTLGEPVEFTLTGLRFQRDLSEAEFADLGTRLGVMERASRWWIGDWHNYGENRYGEHYSQLVEATGLSYSSLRDCAYVAYRVELSRRRDNLSWSHHQEVAKLDAADQDAWLDRTALEAWTQKELRRQLRAGPSVDPPTGSYSVIYADPPWEYDFVATPDSRAVENHYPTMSLEAIKTLPVPADDPAVLFLWATTAKLTEAIEVVGAWGFNYRTSAVWVKDRIGMGYYVRGRHEFLLIATRGDASPPPEHRRRDSVIEAPRGAHSVKPDEFYELIEFMYPEATRIELFARRPREGWVAWGNET